MSVIGKKTLKQLWEDSPPTSPTNGPKRILETPDIWHMTPDIDTWHMTPDMWHVVGGEHSLRISAY